MWNASAGHLAHSPHLCSLLCCARLWPRRLREPEPLLREGPGWASRELRWAHRPTVRPPASGTYVAPSVRPDLFGTAGHSDVINRLGRVGTKQGKVQVPQQKWPDPTGSLSGGWPLTVADSLPLFSALDRQQVSPTQPPDPATGWALGDAHSGRPWIQGGQSPSLELVECGRPGSKEPGSTLLSL